MSEVKVNDSQVRAALDAAIAMALPVSGGEVRKRLKQLHKALAEGDAASARTRCISRFEGWRCEADPGHVDRGEKHRAGDGGHKNGATWWRRFIDYDVPVTADGSYPTSGGEVR